MQLTLNINNVTLETSLRQIFRKYNFKTFVF